jgi:hypothetical protein
MSTDKPKKGPFTKEDGTTDWIKVKEYNMRADMDQVENHDTEGAMDRRFYSGQFIASHIDDNFAFVSLTKGSAMAKLNRKDVDSLISILHELGEKMDQYK